MSGSVTFHHASVTYMIFFWPIRTILKDASGQSQSERAKIQQYDVGISCYKFNKFQLVGQMQRHHRQEREHAIQKVEFFLCCESKLKASELPIIRRLLPITPGVKTSTSATRDLTPRSHMHQSADTRLNVILNLCCYWCKRVEQKYYSTFLFFNPHIEYM